MTNSSYKHVYDTANIYVFAGQEFLDAFPVNQFVKTGGVWREKLVDVDSGLDSPYHFRAVISPVDTAGASVWPSQYEV